MSNAATTAFEPSGPTVGSDPWDNLDEFLDRILAYQEWCEDVFDGATGKDIGSLDNEALLELTAGNPALDVIVSAYKMLADVIRDAEELNLL